MEYGCNPTLNLSLNKDWLFYDGDDNEAYYMGFDDRAWRRVMLPHDWAVGYPFDQKYASGTGYLPGGVGWYRKHFSLSEQDVQRRVILQFDGVYGHTRVWINSNYLGENAYGYAPFWFDISAYVRPGENVIAVRVEHEEVADSRWYTGSGIYRDVSLCIRDCNGFTEDSVFLSTQSLDTTGNATLRLQFQTFGADKVVLRLLADTKEAASAGMDAASGSGTLVVTDAILWSPDRPFLYEARIEAYKNDTIIDVVSFPFGIRTLRFDADQGFFLNGVPTLLKGVCIHHDAGALGAAVPAQVWERRLLTLKKAGCNAIRTAHNPPSKHLLDLCDRLGLLVMDEAFDEWEGCKNKWWQGHNVYPPKHYGYATDFPLWHEHDLSAMVRRDRNHPCVILWSIGNEIDYPNDPYVTPLFDEVLGNNDNGKPERARRYDNKKPDAGRLAVVAKELSAIVHTLDDTRPVLSAMSFPELSTRTGFSDALDVFGYNYREQFYDEDHLRFPQKPILGSENGHDPTVWQIVLDRPFIGGQFLWTGIDFLGECRGWPVRISQAGLLDLCGYPKPLYYQRMALWTTQPFVKIAVGKGTMEQSSPWKDTFLYDAAPGETVCVCVYTNTPKVSLYLNGRCLGTKHLSSQDACRLLWSFPFEKGTLTAKADGVSDSLTTPELPVCISLQQYKPCLSTNDGIVQVQVALLDEAGIICGGSDREIRYQLHGDGVILGIENGKPDDLTPYAADYRHTYYGQSIVYVRKNTPNRALTLFAFTNDGLSSEIEL